MAQNLVLPVGLTEHDLEERKNRITASDVPAIMGTSPWKTAYDVWLEKCRPVEPLKSTTAMMWGNLLEQPILLYTRAILATHLKMPELKVTRAGIRRKHPNGVMACTLDARLVGPGLADAVEAKTHAACHYHEDLSQWGEEPFTDAVPPHYRDQVCGQFACCPEINRIWVVLSVGRMEPTIYVLRREALIDRIVEIENTVCSYWDRFIVTDTPPEDVRPTLDTVKRVRVPVDPVTQATLVDAELVRSRELATQLGKMKKEKDSVDAAIRARMIGCDHGRSPAGHSASLQEINKSEYTVAASSYTRLNVVIYGIMKGQP